ncbi:hypothetical protein GCM10020370_65750 [Paenibacillus hodogayensis]
MRNLESMGGEAGGEQRAGLTEEVFLLDFRTLTVEGYPFMMYLGCKKHVSDRWLSYDSFDLERTSGGRTVEPGRGRLCVLLAGNP